MRVNDSKKKNRVNETKNCFFEKINKMDKTLASSTKKKTQKITKFRNQSEDITL